MSPLCRLLTIGNSFAHDATCFLPNLAASTRREIEIYGANLGGHSFKQHCRYLELYRKDRGNPEGRPYPPLTPGAECPGLPEILQSREWDIVTIQQTSKDSPFHETYEPYATILIEEIRRQAPQARIFIHETWAYREDSPDYTSGFTQESMYEGLKHAYETLALQHRLPIIPVGTAFQNVRSTPEWQFSYPDPDFDYEQPALWAVPHQPGSLNRGWNWGKEIDKPAFQLDPKHADDAGKYLGSCVFFEKLFRASVLDCSFVPESLTPEQAAQLRKIAHDTVAARR